MKPRHTWKPDLARAREGIEVCKRPGCKAERKPSTRAGGGKFEVRADPGAPWSAQAPPCTGDTAGEKARGAA